MAKGQILERKTAFCFRDSGHYRPLLCLLTLLTSVAANALLAGAYQDLVSAEATISFSSVPSSPNSHHSPPVTPERIHTEPKNGRRGPKRIRIDRSRLPDSVATAERDAISPVAEALINEGKRLSETWTQAGLLSAISKFDAARSHWRRIGRTSEEIDTLNAIGDAYVDLAEYRKALQSYSEGLSRAKNPKTQAASFNRISLVHIYLGDPDRALYYCERANRLSRDANDLREQARGWNNRGEIYYSFGKYEESILTLGQALLVWQESDARDKIRTLLNLGYAHFDLRRIERARNYYEQALLKSRESNDKRGEALALTAIGGVCSYLGDKQAALDYQDLAIKLFRRIGDRNGEAVALNGLGYIYRGLGKYQESLHCYLHALRLFQVLGNREAENFTVTLVGKAYEGLGDNAKALEFFELAIERTPRYSQTRAGALNSIGGMFERSREWQKAFANYRRALTLYTLIKDKMNQAASLNRIGNIYTKLGDSAQGLKYFRRALVFSRLARDPFGEVSNLFDIAAALRRKEDYEGARTKIEESLKIIESLRMKVASQNSRASYVSSIHHHYELHVDILMQLDKQQPAGNFAALSFNSAERARSRSLLESLKEARADIRAGVEPALLERERELEQKLNSEAERHTQLIAARKTEEAKSTAKQIDQLTTEYDEVKAQIKSKSPRYAALTQTQPLTLNEIQQQVLDDDSVLLAYMLGDERSYLWIVTRTEMKNYELPPRAQIEAAARKFRELLTVNQPLSNETFDQHQARIREANAQIHETATSLGKLLIGPAIGRVGTKRLLIVPDGALQYIPFQALMVPATTIDSANSGELVPLLVDHEIVYQPSASALALVRADSAQRKAPNSVAVFAHPVFESDDSRVNSSGGVAPQISDLSKANVQQAFRDVGLDEKRIPALPASREEAEAIMAVAPWGSALKAIGFDASRATVTKPEMAQYRIVHFATHGFVDYQHPELSGLVLSLVDQNGQPQDGFLRLHDIYNLKLSANLVVLSACNTGLGKEIKGEGLIGLTRGFMYAGASGVAASLWKVDDAATAELMKGFYEGMFRKGLTPAAALRESQLAMRRQKRWNAPYYWAAFIIQGQYDQKEETTSRTPKLGWPALMSGLASAALIAAFHLLRRRRSRIL